MIQWTLAIELRGSMLVYLILVVTASFTPYYRCLVFVVLLAYSIYLGDLLGEIPFYTGALLADLAIILQKDSVSTRPRLSGQYSWIKGYWPIALALLALYISSYPTNNAHLAGWSRFLTDLGTTIFHPKCNYPLNYSTV